MGVSAKKFRPADFVHLHNHTQYSLLDGLTKVPALVEHVKKLGMDAVAVTDHGTLSGVIEFYKEAHAQNIKPIIGIETYVAPRGRTDRDPARDKTPYHLILLAMNNTGYQNLMRLSTIANLEGFYYKPRVDHELLEKYNEGLIALSGCIGGEVGDALRQGQYKQAADVANWYKKVFAGRYYLELQDHGHPDHPTKWDEQVNVNQEAIHLSKELDVPCVVTSDAHYLHHADQEAHEILLCVQTGSFLSDPKRMSLKNFELHVADPMEVIKRWSKDNPQFITNTKMIADRCNVTLELGKILIPKFEVPKGQTEQSYLRAKVYQGLAWRYGKQPESEAKALTEKAAQNTLPQAVKERAKYELGVIDTMGFNGYFLIIADFIGWGKDNGIVFGPGRGSAAGSIISYALKITELDPLKYNLLFERFLNPDRISMPDIDIDIQDSRRDEVIQYCVQKYGSERVANIVTFGRMAARNAIRDVARVLQVPYSDADRLSKMIPPPVQGRHILLSKSLQDDADLKREYQTNEQSKKVFDLAVQMEGTIRSHGVHAAGVVIAPDDIVRFVPLEMAQKGVVATQYAMGPVEELGLLKMDFLGLSNLTTIKNALRIIKKVHGKNVNIDDIPMDDKKTYALLGRGDTTGVFQLESSGMKRYLKELKPNLFEDIIAMVSLYRPGPMAELPRYIIGKHDPQQVVYLHESLKPILENTYGVMVYQEQIIAMLQLAAGYTPGEADLVRKAIGKKKRDIMQAEEPKFINGCLKQGLTKAEAEKLWSLIQPFADYSFNKSHAACYAMIAYQTAYLKAHYPDAFMAALMTSDFDNIDRLAIEINECKHVGIEVLPPDVNESFVEFAVVPGKKQIRFGMNAIKNVGTGAVEEILRARALDGSFETLEDFLTKVNSRTVNRKTIESLIKAGALDRFESRGVLLANIDVLLAYANRMQKQLESGQTDLFGQAADAAPTRRVLQLAPASQPLSTRDQLTWERELLGIYLSHHPLDAYETLLTEQTVALASLSAEHDGKTVTIGGAVIEAREIITKNGQKMAFVRLGDKTHEIELILFPTIYQQTTGIWERDKVVIVRGKITAKDKDGSLTLDIKVLIEDAREVTSEQADAYQKTGKKKSTPKPSKLQPIDKASNTPSVKNPTVSPRIYVRLANGKDPVLLGNLRTTIDECPGETEVVLVLGTEAKKQIIRLPMRMDNLPESLARLENLVGAINVKLQ